MLSQSGSGRAQNGADVRPTTLVIALVAIALVLAFAVWRMQPPAAKGVEAPPGGFSAGRAYAVLQDLLAEGTPHPTGSESNSQVRERIVAKLESLGYEVAIQEAISCYEEAGTLAICASPQNILGRLPGQEHGPAVMLVAHYDSVGAGPGAADDGSNVATIIEIARILKEEGSHRNPVIFLFTDAEEVGLLGAKAFADEHPWAEDVGVVINLEARGTSGRSLMFETSEDNAWLIDVYSSATLRPAANSLSFEIYQLLPNSTDLSIFKEAGMPGLNVAFIEGAQHYHSPLDNLENLDLSSVQDQGESVLAIVRKLAAMDLSHPTTGNVAYTDVLGFGMIRWPETWTIPLSVLALLLLLTAAGTLLFQHRLTVRAVLWGCLAALLSIITPIPLGLGLTWLIGMAAGITNQWPAYPLPVQLSLWMGTLLCGSLAATGLARKAGLWGLGLGTWLLWSLLSLITSFLLGTAAIMLLVPTLCAALLVAVTAISPLSRSATACEIAFVAITLVAAIIWLPLALDFEAALGLNLNPLIMPPLALVVSTLVPLFAQSKTGIEIRKWLIIATGAATVVAAAVAMLLPPHSESSPQHLNVYYFENRDAGIAHWVMLARPKDVPDALRLQLDNEPQAVFPPLDEEEYVVAKAEPSIAPAPEWQLISEEHISGERVVEIQLHSPRGAPELDLFLPIDNLKSITVAGNTFSVTSEDSSDEYYAFWCLSQACEELKITLRFESVDPVEAFLMDFSYGLPPGGEGLIRARPATAVPADEGDSTVIMRHVEF